MTSKDQLSPMLIGWLLLLASEGLRSVGPKTVAKLCSDILLTFSFSATLRTRGVGGLTFDLRHPNLFVCVCVCIPLEVVQQEKEGDQVGFRQRQQQVQHAALLGHAVRQS